MVGGQPLDYLIRSIFYHGINWTQDHQEQYQIVARIELRHSILQ